VYISQNIPHCKNTDQFSKSIEIKFDTKQNPNRVTMLQVKIANQIAKLNASPY
jgi:hypothetical protein